MCIIFVRAQKLLDSDFGLEPIRDVMPVGHYLRITNPLLDLEERTIHLKKQSAEFDCRSGTN